MKTVIVFMGILGVILAAPQQSDRDAQIVRSISDNIGAGGYKYSYETSNGISADEEGQLRNEGTDNEILAVQGQFQYVGPDGVTYSVTYTADENGFQPQGAHLPVAQ